MVWVVLTVRIAMDATIVMLVITELTVMIAKVAANVMSANFVAAVNYAARMLANTGNASTKAQCYLRFFFLFCNC